MPDPQAQYTSELDVIRRTLNTRHSRADLPPDSPIDLSERLEAVLAIALRDAAPGELDDLLTAYEQASALRVRLAGRAPQFVEFPLPGKPMRLPCGGHVWVPPGEGDDEGCGVALGAMTESPDGGCHSEGEC